ncbi:hypothetical protein D3C72_2498850 [compost metagenome]
MAQCQGFPAMAGRGVGDQQDFSDDRADLQEKHCHVIAAAPQGEIGNRGLYGHMLVHFLAP